IKRYRPYLEDRRFLDRTDNKALSWLHQARDQKAKLTRWTIELQQYSFDIEHCPGKENQLPDYLSRHPSEETPEVVNAQLACPTACPVEVLPLADEVRNAQREH